MVAGQTPSEWDHFLRSLQERYGSGPVRLESEYGAFESFARSLPEDAVIPLLLNAYDRYRDLCLSDHDAPLVRDCYSILIRTILQRKPPVTETHALAILRSAYHACGHGDDVSPPIEFALGVFENKPYSSELFAAVSCYREALRHVRASSAFNTKRRIELVLWHDPSRVLPKCHSRRIQLALAAMSERQRSAWQMLLRHQSLAMGPSPGQAWFREAQRRICAIEACDFVARLDEWFTFPTSEPVVITGTGSHILRTLMWAGSLVPDQRVPSILRRTKAVRWKGDGSAKVIAALQWIESREQSLQRTHS